MAFGTVGKASNLVVRLVMDTSNFDRSSKKAREKVQKMQGIMRKAGAAASGAALGIGSIAAAFLAISKTGAEFDHAMTRAVTVMGKTGKAFDSTMTTMTKKAMDLAAGTEFSALQVAQGFEELGRAGMSAEDIQTSMNSVLAVATIANTSLAEAAKFSTTVMSQFGLTAAEAETVASAMAVALTSSKLSFESLSAAMVYAGPAAAAVGLEFQHVFTTLGHLANMGIEGSIAGTALRMAFQKLLKPTESAGDILDKLNMSYEDLAVGKKFVNEQGKEEIRTLENINVKMLEAGASLADFNELYGMRAGASQFALGKAVLVEQKMAEMFKDQETLEGKIFKARKEAIEMQTTLMNTVTGKMQQLGSAIKNIMISTFSGMQTGIEGGLGFILEFFQDLDTEIQMRMGRIKEAFDAAFGEFGEHSIKSETAAAFFGNAIENLATSFARLIGVVGKLKTAYDATFGRLASHIVEVNVLFSDLARIIEIALMKKFEELSKEGGNFSEILKASLKVFKLMNEPLLKIVEKIIEMRDKALEFIDTFNGRKIAGKIGEFLGLTEAVEDFEKVKEAQENLAKTEKKLQEDAKKELEAQQEAIRLQTEKEEKQKAFNDQYQNTLNLQAQALEREGQFVEATELRIKSDKIAAAEEAKGIKFKGARSQFWHNKSLEWTQERADAKERESEEERAQDKKTAEEKKALLDTMNQIRLDAAKEFAAQQEEDRRKYVEAVNFLTALENDAELAKARMNANSFEGRKVLIEKETNQKLKALKQEMALRMKMAEAADMSDVDLSRMKQAFRDLFDEVKQEGVDAVNEIDEAAKKMNFGNSIAKQLFPKIQGAIARFKELKKELGSSGKAAGAMLGQMVGKGMLAAAEAVKKLLKELGIGKITDMKAMVADARGMMEEGMSGEQAGQQAATNMVNDVTMQIQAWMDALPHIMDKVAESVPMLMEKFAEALPVIISKFITSMPRIIFSMINGLLKAVPKIVLAVISALPELLQAILNWVIVELPVIIQMLVMELVFGLLKMAPKLVMMMLKLIFLEIPKMVVMFIKGMFEAMVNALSQFFGRRDKQFQERKKELKGMRDSGQISQKEYRRLLGIAKDEADRRAGKGTRSERRDQLAETQRMKSGGGVNQGQGTGGGSFYTGISYVPKTLKGVTLHKGERVVPAHENEQSAPSSHYQKSGGDVSVSTNVVIDGSVVDSAIVNSTKNGKGKGVARMMRRTSGRKVGISSPLKR